MQSIKALFKLNIIPVIGLLLFTACSEDGLTVTENNEVTKEHPSKIIDLQNWFRNQSVKKEVYIEHRWESAQITDITDTEYVIEIPLAINALNNNYHYTATYIFKDRSYRNRLSAKPLKIFKGQYHQPTFVSLFVSPTQIKSVPLKTPLN
tara:strand:+ start:201 stop:650 length:450 start_codon:yes stop_codon:yes gene_type:complete